jgi:hypothetical protein
MEKTVDVLPRVGRGVEVVETIYEPEYPINSILPIRRERD